MLTKGCRVLSYLFTRGKLGFIHLIEGESVRSLHLTMPRNQVNTKPDGRDEWNSHSSFGERLAVDNSHLKLRRGQELAGWGQVKGTIVIEDRVLIVTTRVVIFLTTKHVL